MGFAAQIDIKVVITVDEVGEVRECESAPAPSVCVSVN